MEKREILERFSGAEQSMNVVPVLPLIELLGDRRLLVENHRGILLYGRDEIEVKLTIGTLCVVGCGLCIAYMSKHRLVINGTVKSLSISRM